MNMAKRINPGALLPRFYGIAWRDYATDQAVCLPVPLNAIGAMLRSCWITLRSGWRAVQMNPRDAFLQGQRYANEANKARLAAQGAEIQQLCCALQFYADGGHFLLSDDTAWDTVSGEPQNLWCDEAGTATIEDGSIATHALGEHLTRSGPFGHGAERLVRYCPGCGSVGPIEDTYQDCCPDGGEARMIPESLAEKCRSTFKIAVQALSADGIPNGTGKAEAMALQAIVDAHDELFVQACSNPILNAWGKELSLGAFNRAYELASAALAQRRRASPAPNLRQPVSGAQGGEQAAFDAAWPRIHKFGISDGWMGVACAAWNERAALARQQEGGDAELSADDLELFASAYEHFEDGVDTTTGTADLMKFVRIGLLECTRFEVTEKGNAAYAASAQRAAGRPEGDKRE
jgi:hypothetical protein